MRIESFFSVVVVGTAGCFSITTVNIGQKTALERQLIGAFEPLTDEEMLAASVRAASGPSDVAADDAQARATFARQRQLFNRDDVDELKSAGCLGEAFDATVVARPCAAAKDEATRALLMRMIAEENEDRAAIINWVAGSSHAASGASRAQLVALYHHLQLEQARSRDWIEEPKGTWQRR
jgi:hypothetical protein